ncbi:3-hydroxyacyl-CoA dehydrogenase family protein [Kitasatospora sp. NPDC087861]|uniref:3-hydroxyacyl-CoA dehydrogenase family protein n=1 Tax=Kitasatospora sp. NPDC087861 TaxID=3364070 RepID=UPI003808927A
MSEIHTVGVVGAGVMGTGLAQALAQTGHQVLLVDRTEEILAAAERTIREGLRFARLLGAKGPARPANDRPKEDRPKEDRETVLKRITLTTGYEGFEEADFVIENITEDWGLKQGVYRRLDAVCPPRTVFAANTSVIPITRIGAATSRPAQVLGMHFMNPVPLKPVVEMIRGHHTSAETVATARTLLAQLGKEGILVEDSPGFVTNRVLMLTVNEAVYLVHEGVAGAAEVDRIFKTCFGHTMGPLETADLIGLDTILQSVEGLYAAFSDSKYRPCPLLVRMVDAGLLGRKSGQGFYDYATTAA